MGDFHRRKPRAGLARIAASVNGCRRPRYRHAGAGWSAVTFPAAPPRSRPDDRDADRSSLGRKPPARTRSGRRSVSEKAGEGEDEFAATFVALDLLAEATPAKYSKAASSRWVSTWCCSSNAWAGARPSSKSSPARCAGGYSSATTRSFMPIPASRMAEIILFSGPVEVLYDWGCPAIG